MDQYAVVNFRVHDFRTAAYLRIVSRSLYSRWLETSEVKYEYC